MLGRQRLSWIDVERRATEMAGMQGGDQRLGVEDLRAADVDDHGALRQRGNLRRSDQPQGLRRQRRGNHQDGGLLQERADVAGTEQLIHRGHRPLVTAPSQRDHAHAKGMGASGDRRANGAHPNQTKGPAVQ